MKFSDMSEDNQIKEDLKAMRTSLINIETVLRGDSKSDSPSGLVYSVSKNTKFRLNITKVFWVLFTANAGIILYLLTLLINGD